jgi:hypothetical protein
VTLLSRPVRLMMSPKGCIREKNWRQTGFTEEEARDIRAAAELIESWRPKPITVDPEWWAEMIEK